MQKFVTTGHPAVITRPTRQQLPSEHDSKPRASHILNINVHEAAIAALTAAAAAAASSSVEPLSRRSRIDSAPTANGTPESQNHKQSKNGNQRYASSELKSNDLPTKPQALQKLFDLPEHQALKKSLGQNKEKGTELTGLRPTTTAAAVESADYKVLDRLKKDMGSSLRVIELRAEDVGKLEHKPSESEASSRHPDTASTSLCLPSSTDSETPGKLTRVLDSSSLHSAWTTSESQKAFDGNARSSKWDADKQLKAASTTPHRQNGTGRNGNGNGNRKHQRQQSQRYYRRREQLDFTCHRWLLLAILVAFFIWAAVFFPLLLYQ